MKITKRKVSIAVVIVMFIAIIINTFIKNGVTNIKEMYTNTSALENVYYVTQTLSCVFVIVGVLIAVWQYVLSSRSEISRYNNEKIERAINLAEYYREHVLTGYAFLKNVFEEAEVKDIILKIRINDIKEFNKTELTNLLAESDVNAIKEKINSKEFVNIILKIINERGYCFKNGIVKEILIKREEDGNYDLTESEVKAVKITFLNEIVNETLNCMEYMAMSFTHNIADETVVFSSLGPTYLEIVHLLYYNIAVNNEGHKRLFLNVSELFTIWRDRTNKVKKDMSEVNRRSVSIGNKAEKRID